MAKSTKDFTINVVRELVPDSSDPFPVVFYRRAGGDHSGEKIKKVLVKAIRTHDHVTADLSDSIYYGSSFLKEAFGGLVREVVHDEGFSIGKLQEKLTIKHDMLPSVVYEANMYMEKAAEAGA